MSDDADELPGVERFREFLRNQGRSLASNARQAGFFDHRPTSGTAREWVLRKPLEEVLPSRYGVSSGQVLAANGTLSGQWDVLIYSRPDTPLLFNSPAATVLPIEGILAAISVKSSVDKAAIDDAAAAAKVLRSMPLNPDIGGSVTGGRGHIGICPPTFVFGFTGLALSTLIEHAKDAGEQPVKWDGDGEPAESEASVRPSVLTGICVLDSGLVLPMRGDDGQVAIEKIEGYVWADTESGDGAWGLFLAILWRALQMTPQMRPNLLKYIGLGGMLDNPGQDWGAS
jgi:hypothetical protein